MDDIHIEYSRPWHLREVDALEATSFTIPPELLASVTTSRRRLPGVRLVALKDDHVVGYLTGMWFFEPPPVRGCRSLYIMALAVDGRYQRRGIGRRLLTSTFERGGARGARSFHLHVQVENTGAIALYQSLNFEVRQRNANAYGPGLHCLLMVRPARVEDRGTAGAG
jgi:ribosomal protein S18 acetylase RimI-like enzyme